MAKKSTTRIKLDYTQVGTKKLLENISGVAAIGDVLWTVSDERRTFECLQASRGGFVLVEQFNVDDLIPEWPGRPGTEEGGRNGAELDLEAIDIADNALWLCGSHCHVRMKPDRPEQLNAQIRPRPSRHLLARIELGPEGRKLGKVKVAPIEGPRSVRGALADDDYLKLFLGLPSKENGLDIEGMVVFGKEVLLGLRGPILDNIAVVVHLTLDDDLGVSAYQLSFLNLGGLAVRDLCRSADGLLIIAGPVSDADGPFRLYRWRPKRTPNIQTPEELLVTLTENGPPGQIEKPEGMCFLERDGEPGFLFVYDRPADEDGNRRIKGNIYRADWRSIG